jgi:predicted nucleic acid-binding protein
MSAPVFFDSNVLIYAFTQAGTKTDAARQILSLGGVISVQGLNETANTLRRKFSVGWPRIVQISDRIVSLCPSPLSLSLSVHRGALRLCERYRFSVYDALVVAAALEAGCTTLYSEDMQDGQIVEGLRIVNPFLKPSDR